METVTLVHDESVTDLANAKNTILQLREQIAQSSEALAAKEKELSSCKRAHARLSARNRELLNHQRWERDLFAMKGADPAKVLTAWAVREKHRVVSLGKGKPVMEPGGPVVEMEEQRLCLESLADLVPLSPQAVSDGVKWLDGAGLVTKTKHWDREKGINYNTLAPKPEMLRPRALVIPEEKKSNHGGKRVRCPDPRCKSENILETWVCGDCGTVIPGHDRRPVNPLEVKHEEAEAEQVQVSGDTAGAPDGRMAGDGSEVAEAPERPSPTRVHASERSVLPGLLGHSTNPEITPVSTLYFDRRPTPEECSHPKNLIRKLGDGWYCSECGGRNEELLKWGGAS